MKTSSEQCGVCKDTQRRLALKVNEVPVCYGCVGFFTNQAKVDNRPVISVIEDQTLYVRNHQ